jgi:hypothetical protein
MAFKAHHSINTAADGVNIRLIETGENVNNIKSILLTNTDSNEVQVDLYIQDSDDVKYHLLYNMKIPIGVSLLLDSDDMLSFNNTSTGYSLNLTTNGATDLIDVLIKK